MIAWRLADVKRKRNETNGKRSEKQTEDNVLVVIVYQILLLIICESPAELTYIGFLIF